MIRPEYENIELPCLRDKPRTIISAMQMLQNLEPDAGHTAIMFRVKKFVQNFHLHIL